MPPPGPEIDERSYCSSRFAMVQPRFCWPIRFDFSAFDVVEEALAEIGVAGDQMDRFDGDARLIHREQHEADAVVFRRGRIGAHQTENPVGLVGERRPDLRTVDQVVVAAVFGARLQRREIRTRARFRISLAPTDLSARDLRQMLGALCFVAEFEQRRADHADAHAGERRRRTDRRHLGAQRAMMCGVETGAAIGLRPARHRPAAFVARVEPAPPRRADRFLRAALEARPGAAQFRAGNCASSQLARLAAKCRQIRHLLIPHSSFLSRICINCACRSKPSTIGDFRCRFQPL